MSKRFLPTKGAGMGLGTCSARLLTERYPVGDASSSTSVEGGTTFKANYPLDLSSIPG
jgi:hypothetical protein